MILQDCPETGLPPRALRLEPINAAAPVEIAWEHGMDIYINGQFSLRAVCTPEHLAELAAGRLVTEGWVRSKEEIASIIIGEGGLRADVTLTGAPGKADAPPPVTPRPWQADWLRKAAARMREEEPLYSATHAVHACYLGRGDELLCCREDLGRHNALDKAVGHALLTGVHPRDCFLFITGRMPADMVRKAAWAGIPLLASKTYPTQAGIALAQSVRLTLVTLRPDGSALIWTDGQEKEHTP